MSQTISYRVKHRWKYRLTRDVQFETGIRPERHCETSVLSLSRSGLLRVFRGYAWDGPSGPALDTRSFMRGSLVHDALYQLMRDGLLDGRHRAESDDLMRRLHREDARALLAWRRRNWRPVMRWVWWVGGPLWNIAIEARVTWCWVAVRLFGWLATRADIYEAPHRSETETGGVR